MRGDDVQLVIDLVARFPILEDSYEVHVFNEDGILPHVFFWDVTQDVVSSYISQDPDSLDWRSVLSFLEDRMRGGIPEESDVICTSFLWYLPHRGDPGYGIISQMGPLMTSGFRRIRPGE
ncbi:hypothetical protein [Streptomyces sp. NPDC060333]|uniref:hypothetical protein n=1 Tax=Streptomyces sp. NPDC060333 TaxID=3347098 RepID=UPI00365881B8